ncbi:MAG TPA: murein biosynthesis integral membrane protein MurJ [Thermoanaerobaculia bacterium]|nr:murein biosynthesis integral membrane protein MurJ [Thermoanaerobaculia bacterium]
MVDRAKRSRPVASAASSSRIVAAGILASRSLGLVREMLLAALAGTGLAADVVQFALRGPNVLQNLLGEQALSASFIPIYSRMLAEGRESEARRFAGAVFGLLGLVVAALAVGLAVIAPAWVTVFAPGFLGRPEAFGLAVTAIRILLPMSAVLVLSSWCLAVLNSHRRFFLPYFAPVLWNVSLVAALGALAWRVEAPVARTVVLTVAVAALVGGVLQFAVQVPLALRMNGGLDPRPSLGAPGVRPAIRTFLPALLGRGSVQLSGTLDYLLASLLAAGAISALGFAQRLYLLPVALFGTALAVVELPEVSRLDPASGGDESLERLEFGIGQVGFLTVPAAVGFLTLGWLVVAVVYQRGEFVVADTWLVYGVLGTYALGLVASTTSRLVQNVFYAGRDTATPAKRGILRVLVQGSVGGALMLWLDRYSVARLTGDPGDDALRLGAVGLAAGSAVAAWVELGSLVAALRARGAAPAAAPKLPWRRLALFAAVAIAASVLSGLVWLLARELPTILVAILVLPTFIASYLAIAGLLKLPELVAFWGRLRPFG